MSTTTYHQVMRYQADIDQTKVVRSSTYQESETTEPYVMWEPQTHYERGNSIPTYEPNKGDEQPNEYYTNGETVSVHRWKLFN